MLPDRIIKYYYNMLRMYRRKILRHKFLKTNKKKTQNENFFLFARKETKDNRNGLLSWTEVVSKSFCSNTIFQVSSPIKQGRPERGLSETSESSVWNFSNHLVHVLSEIAPLPNPCKVQWRKYTMGYSPLYEAECCLTSASLQTSGKRN